MSDDEEEGGTAEGEGVPLDGGSHGDAPQQDTAVAMTEFPILDSLGLKLDLTKEKDRLFHADLLG